LIYRTRGRGHHFHRSRTADYLAAVQGLAEAEGLPGPLVVCVDHRGGNRTILSPDMAGLEFPAPIAMGALGDDAERAAEEIGRAIARDVLDVGFNLNLAPYGDFMEMPKVERFVFGNAMMGKSVDVNAAISRGLTRGMRSEGLGATYCVFPGGYGSLKQDPHHFAAIINADRADLDRRFLPIPKAAFAEGAEAVMMSHCQFPKIDPDSNPATYSPVIIQDLLRRELGFDGLVMTDSLRMRSVVNLAGGRGEAAVRSIEAGVDMVLCVNWEERLAIEAAVKSGRISAARVEEAIERIQQLKRKLARRVPGKQSSPDVVDQGRMTHWIGRSIGWARKPREWRPLGTAGRSAAPPVFVSPHTRFLDAAGAIFGPAARLIRLNVANNFLDDPALEDDQLTVLQQLLEGSQGRVVFHTDDASDLSLAGRLLRSGVDVTVVHSGSALLVEGFPDLPAVLLSYSPTPVACRAGLEVVAGVREATGEISAPITVSP
jgi:beta-glucosidase-like glycosyl hydrolase